MSCIKPGKYCKKKYILVLIRLLDADPLRIFQWNGKNRYIFLGISNLSILKNKSSHVLKTNLIDNNKAFCHTFVESPYLYLAFIIFKEEGRLGNFFCGVTGETNL